MFVKAEPAFASITEAMLSTSCPAAVMCSNSVHNSSAISISIAPALARLLCWHAGHLTQGISLYSDLLAELQPEVCSGLYAELLVKKADAQRQQGQFDAALQDLDCAMAWEPENADCLRLRASVWHNTDSMAGAACCLLDFLSTK
jgi:tetratricopeptide (TPR) repeat protein